MSVMFVVTGDQINLTIDGEPKVLHASHQSYDKIVAILKSGKIDKDEILTLMDPAKKVKEFGEGHLKIKDGVVTYTGLGKDIEVSVDNSLIGRIEAMHDEGFPVTPLVKFFENLMKNPSNHAVTGLYKFLEKNQLPLTDDGHFLAYKKVRHDYGSIHTAPDGTHLDNTPGKTVEMLRNQVDDDHRNTCSAGLHFAGLSYAKDFYSWHDKDDHMIVVKVNPADVVAFPNDYNSAKGRTCRYEVVSEVPNDGMEYMVKDIQGVDSIDEVRDLIKKVRELVKPFLAEDADLKLNDEITGLHKTKVAKLIDAVKAEYKIEAEYEDKLSIYRFVKFISNEIDLSEGKEEAAE